MRPSNRNDLAEHREDEIIEAARRDVFEDSTDASGQTLRSKGEGPGEKSAPAVGDGTTRTLREPPMPLPKRIAHFHVKRVIASGGMGTVYEATQDHPRRTVAVKVMRRSVVSARALRRFEYESQILARLHHSGIAHVYEAGWHDDGGDRVPYFALEYIPNARSILEYADRKQLSMRERLSLFAQVCRAVHHGHQRGIIHRDIKPGNILVDASGQVKIIDFGVARSTDADMNVTTLQTHAGEMVGTLRYMSPEQCQADPNDLDIRSDIYSLGVVLYELLSGQMPYDLTGTPIFSAPRIICESPPARISAFNRALGGDIETIVDKALEKDREHRYQSSLALAEDIDRYLRDEPILARPPSAIYRFRKLVRRRRVPLAAAALLLAVGTIAAAAQARAWQLSRDREEMASRVALIDLVFGTGRMSEDRILAICNRAIELDPSNAKAYALRARVHRIQGRQEQAKVDCEVALRYEPDNVLALRTCGWVALEEGEFERARDLYERGLATAAVLEDLPRDFHRRARLRRLDGEYEAALEDYNRAVALSTDAGKREHQPYRNRGVTRYLAGDISGAIEDLQKAAELALAVADIKERTSAVQCYLWIWEMRMLRDSAGDREAAAAALEKAVRASRGYALAEGIIAFMRGEKDADELLDSIRSPDDRAQAHYYIGTAALVADRAAEAAEHFEKAAVHELHLYEEYELAHWHLDRLQRHD